MRLRRRASVRTAASVAARSSVVRPRSSVSRAVALTMAASGLRISWAMLAAISPAVARRSASRRRAWSRALSERARSSTMMMTANVERK